MLIMMLSVLIRLSLRSSCITFAILLLDSWEKNSGKQVQTLPALYFFSQGIQTKAGQINIIQTFNAQ